MIVPMLPHEIFKAYDIRGIVGRTLTPEDMYWAAAAITALLLLSAHRITRTRPGRALMAIKA